MNISIAFSKFDIIKTILIQLKMDSLILEMLNKKLKDAPQSVLERVMGYVDALIEPEETKKNYTLSEEQQKILDSQVNEDKSHYAKADKLYADLKSKYEL